MNVTEMGEACLANESNQLVSSSGLYSTRNHQEGMRWYALRVRCGGESKVSKALQFRGFSPYYPTQQERRRYSDRMKVVSAAFFPGYLFCRFDSQHKLPIVSTPGVDYILGADAPTAIEEHEIENIRRMVEAGAKSEPYLARGQRVRVTHGPLEGIEGTLVREAQGDKLVVSVTLLNQSASLHIDRDSICPST
jgi:transcription antitermination factor NusG